MTKGQIIQLLPIKTQRHFVKASVTVNHWTDDSWHVLHETYGEIPENRSLLRARLDPFIGSGPDEGRACLWGWQNHSACGIFMLR